MSAPLIWHITERRTWDEAVAEGTYTHSTRGRGLAEQGYIHACMPEQVSAVAQRIYPDRPEDLVILEIDVHRVQASGVAVERQPGTTDLDGAEVPGQIYPHILGPLPISAVVRLRRTRWIGREFVVIA
ncbi:MAG: DUF952 domain-containing protein [Brachybacterium sp.]|nr:DUF952 domain-containing protein [Brachybacterium sp.]